MALTIKHYNVSATATSEFGRYDVNYAVENGTVNSVSATLFDENGIYVGSLSKDMTNVNANVGVTFTENLAAVIAEFTALCEEIAATPAEAPAKGK